MAKSFITLFLLFYGTLSFAQIESYPLADYFRPDLERRTANYTGNFRFINQNNKEINTGAESRTDINLSGNLFFTNFKNTLRNQISSSTRYVLSYNYVVDIDNNKRSRSLLGANITRSFNNKIFKNETKHFFEFNYNFFLSPYTSISKNSSSSSDQYLLSTQLAIEIPLYWGKGRIELVNDAWQAANVLKFLRDESLLQKTNVSHEEITNFADRVSEIQQFRNTDFRLESIAEYEALVQYLIENNLIDPNEYKTFAIILDAWRFENFETRRSGKEFKYGIIPQFTGTRQVFYEEHLFSSSRLINYLDNPRLLGSVAYNSYRPVNMNWQRDFTNQLNIGVGFPNRFFTESDRNLTFVGQVNVSQNFRYLPNQRTNYGISISGSYQYQSALSNTLFQDKLHSISANINGEYNYYFSPRLACSVNANISFGSSDTPFYDIYNNQNGIFASISYRPY